MKPLWKQFFDAVERSTAPALEQMTASSGFAEVTRTGLKISRDVAKQSEVLTRRWLHLWNLPAAGDIKGLRGQIGSLEAEVRTLRRQLDDAGATAGGPAATAAASASANGRASNGRAKSSASKNGQAKKKAVSK